MNLLNPAYQNEKMWVAIDCLVFGYDLQEEQLKVLVFKREVDPFAGDWSLIGGLVGAEESLDLAAKRILAQFTGLSDVFLEPLGPYGQTDRDPGGRVVSILYWSLSKLDHLNRNLAVDHEAKWVNLDEVPALVLDHQQMLSQGVQKLEQTARMSPLGFELLPDQFTLPQLLSLYEAIYQQKIDDRNFRKKIIATGLLQKLNEKDKSSSKKGAFLYRFNTDRYEELKSKGYNLDLLVR